MNQLLFNRRNYVISLEKGVKKDIVQLLENTISGTKGGVLYCHLDTPNRIYEIESPYFLTLRKNEKLIGTLALCQKKCLLIQLCIFVIFPLNNVFKLIQPNL